MAAAGTVTARGTRAARSAAVSSVGDVVPMRCRATPAIAVNRRKYAAATATTPTTGYGAAAGSR
jgi:hypothetical protein